MSKNNKNNRNYLFKDDMQIMMEDMLDQIDFSIFRSDYLVGKFDDDNISKWMKHKEIKAIIHDFYKKEYKYFVYVGVDELLSDESTADDGYRFIMFKLQEELAYKSEYESLNESETILHLMLSNDSSKKHKYVYSDHLVNQFKNVLKEIG